MQKTMKKIGVFVPTYLNTSETFIYTIVANLKTVNPIIFSHDKKNLTKFPIDRIHSFEDLSWHQKLSFDPLNKYGASVPLLKKAGIRLVHAQFGTVGMDLVGLKERWPALPLITHFRGQDAYQLSRDLLSRFKLKKLFRVGELFLTSSTHLREFLVEHLGCPEKKVEVYLGGIDIKKIRFKVRNLRQGRKQIKILMAGRFTEKKGFEYGIRAFFELLARGYDLHMDIIGTGPLEKKLHRLVKQLRLEKVIKFLGAQPHAMVLKKIQESDLLLAPYVTAKSGDSEGVPNILKEALASGLPVVSTRHAGVPEIIVDGVTGFLVNEKAVIMLSRQAEELIKDNTLVEKFAHAGRAHVEKYFELSNQITKLERIYNRFLS